MAKPESLWLDGLINFAKATTRQHGSFTPTFFMRTEGEVIFVDLAPIPNKDHWSDLMRFLILKHKPDEYAFFSESWIRMFDPKKPEERIQSQLVGMGMKQVSEFEDKSECLVIVYGGREKRETIGVLKFHRKKRKIIFGTLDWLPETVGGRLANLWNPFDSESNTN